MKTYPIGGPLGYAALILLFWLSCLVCFSNASAKPVAITVTDARDQPLPLVMLTLYSCDEIQGHAAAEITQFTDQNGKAFFRNNATCTVDIRARKTNFIDQEIRLNYETDAINLQMKDEPSVETRALNAPANAWVAALNFGNAADKEHFRLQCSFCHQQGSAIIRLDRTEEEWAKIIDRMLRYGSRLETRLQRSLPSLIRAEHKRLNDHPELIQPTRAWGDENIGAVIKEWPLADGSGQLHDVYLSASGLVYVGNNLQDDLIELNPVTGRTATHKIPKRDGDKLGGNIGGRLKNFPGIGTYVGLHSLAESLVDGHLFLTGSDSSRLIEFAPENKKFTLYDLPKGFYPHTIRVDHQDRVWFTMAVSNQIAMFDRTTKKFKFYKLSARNFKERLTIAALPMVMKLARMGMDTHKFAVDNGSTGLPMPYGIDIAPDGTVWFTRLHAGDIGRIDPKTGDVKLYKTTFHGPRRLKTDADGNVWITVFGAGQLAKFDPLKEKFTLYDLPTRPLGSETPYALTVDRKRHRVWVNGTASDTMMRFDIKTENWDVYPLPRRGTFTRDVVVARDGSVFTSNGSFPAWHIEDGQPTVLHIIPNDVDKLPVGQALLSSESENQIKH